ncbi:TetR/AcrR family transcriptional regulator [Curtobacterium sp. MCBD17_013]|nr:TetR/AcrR family transcriptional regulator [Curtobacterium sp. MCBD17_028]PZF61515.1 TetR/AcrR family transcriptional regulator [Curtobacterium sp. MCBD17_013]
MSDGRRCTPCIGAPSVSGVTTRTSIDRRAVLKARHRAAILDAARALTAERGGPRFSVDELAARADVARRTVFNHFSSIDEVVLALCGELLTVVLDDFVATATATPVGNGDRASMFDEIAEWLRVADLPTAISSIVRVLGEPPEEDRRGRLLIDEAFDRSTAVLVDEVRRRNPSADPLDAELLVTSLMNGVVVISKHWVLRTGASTDGDGRAQWDALLGRLIDSVRSGYMPQH